MVNEKIDSAYLWVDLFEDCELNISDLNLTGRSYNVLYKKFGKDASMKELAATYKTKNQLFYGLMKLNNLGNKSVEEIVAKVSELAESLSAKRETLMVDKTENVKPEVAQTDVKQVEAAEQDDGHDLTIIRKLLAIWNVNVKKQVEQIIEVAEETISSDETAPSLQDN